MPSKEISIDQSQLVIKDKQPELTCRTVTELEVANAFKCRALAFDLAGASTYNTMAAYHADLMDHLHLPAPPGYTPVSVHQVLQADRAAFLFMSEKMNTLKRSADGTLPLDVLIFYWDRGAPFLGIQIHSISFNFIKVVQHPGNHKNH